MQKGRDIVLSGALQPDGTTQYETDVVAYTDAKGRLRYRGECVQGKPEEPFVYLSWRVLGASQWVMRAKAMLPFAETFISSMPEGTTLKTSIDRMGHRLAGQTQLWVTA